MELTTEQKVALFKIRGEWGGRVQYLPNIREWAAPLTMPCSTFFSTRTIEGLVTKNILEYCEWIEAPAGRFPVAARIKTTTEEHTA